MIESRPIRTLIRSRSVGGRWITLLRLTKRTGAYKDLGPEFPLQGPSKSAISVNLWAEDVREPARRCVVKTGNGQKKSVRSAAVRLCASLAAPDRPPSSAIQPFGVDPLTISLEASCGM